LIIKGYGAFPGVFDLLTGSLPITRRISSIASSLASLHYPYSCTVSKEDRDVCNGIQDPCHISPRLSSPVIEKIKPLYKAFQ